jgi:hypothetical protein
MNRYALTAFLIAGTFLAIFAFSYFSNPVVSVSSVHSSILQGPFASALGDASNGGDACGSTVTVTTILAGNQQPGTCCKQNSDCWSNSCGCHIGGGSADRCCHLGSGRTCNSNDECQSGNCKNGKCEDNTTTKKNNRPNGDRCKVHEDCASGFCQYGANGNVCAPKP